MSDIVKRLRSIRGNFVIPIESPPIFQWAEDAANEIDRLTAEVKNLKDIETAGELTFHADGSVALEDDDE